MSRGVAATGQWGGTRIRIGNMLLYTYYPVLLGGAWAALRSESPVLACLWMLEMIAYVGRLMLVTEPNTREGRLNNGNLGFVIGHLVFWILSPLAVCTYGTLLAMEWLFMDLRYAPGATEVIIPGQELPVIEILFMAFSLLYHLADCLMGLSYCCSREAFHLDYPYHLRTMLSWYQTVENCRHHPARDVARGIALPYDP